MRCSKSSTKREFYSNKHIQREKRKISNTQANFTLQGNFSLKEEQPKPKVSIRKEIKIKAEINEIKTRKTIEKTNKN